MGESSLPLPSLYSSGGKSALAIGSTGRAIPRKNGTQILEVPVGDVVDFVIDNTETMMYHPFHLHGYSFWVLGAGPGAPPAQAPTPASPVLKDNQNVPAGGGHGYALKPTTLAGGSSIVTS